MSIEQSFDRVMNALVWEENPVVAVGFSGGKDSTELLRLVRLWCRENNGRVVALHVDHKMREESTIEAQHVRLYCQQKGIECVILSGQRPDSQTTARGVRYELMGQWCQSHRVSHLLLAHHYDDQRETVLMRVRRQSTLWGLRGMEMVVPTLWGRIIRPLLRTHSGLWEKGDIVVKDPSNVNRVYERVRVRQELEDVLTQNFVDEVHDKACKDLLEKKKDIEGFLASFVRVAREGYVVCDVRLMRLEPSLIDLILSRIVMAVSGRVYAPRRRVLEGVLCKIPTMPLWSKVTVGGCVIIRERGQLCVLREHKRVADVVIEPRSRGMFDRRFMVYNSTYRPIAVSAWGKRARNNVSYKHLARPVIEEKGRFREMPLVSCNGGVYALFCPPMPVFGVCMHGVV